MNLTELRNNPDSVEEYVQQYFKLNKLLGIVLSDKDKRAYRELVEATAQSTEKIRKKFPEIKKWMDNL